MKLPEVMPWLMDQVRERDGHARWLLGVSATICGATALLLAAGWLAQDTFWEGVFVGCATTLLFVLFLPLLEDRLRRRTETLGAALKDSLDKSRYVEPLPVVERRVSEALAHSVGDQPEDVVRQLLSSITELGLQQTSVVQDGDRSSIVMESGHGQGGGEHQGVIAWEISWDPRRISQKVSVDDAQSTQYTAAAGDAYAILSGREECVRFIDGQLSGAGLST